MKVSIIVPVYNAEKYLNDCMDSILAQTYADFELILVDDGSADGSGEICEKYAAQDDRVRVFRKENGGAASARNAGLDLANGECILFADSDDILHPSLLEYLVIAMEQEQAEISLSGYQSFEEGNPVRPETYRLRRTAVGRDFCLEPYNIDYVGPVAKLFRKELFSDLRFPEALRMCEDEAVLYRLLYKCTAVAELGSKLYYYRKTPGSLMNTQFSYRNYDIVPVLKDKLAFFEQEGDAELVAVTKAQLRLLRAKLSLKARRAGIYGETAEENRMGRLAALKTIRAADSPELYQWYLAITFPRAARGFEYYRACVRKVKRMLT